MNGCQCFLVGARPFFWIAAIFLSAAAGWVRAIGRWEVWRAGGDRSAGPVAGAHGGDRAGGDVQRGRRRSPGTDLRPGGAPAG